MLTFISLDDIQELERDISSENYKPNTAQKILAREVTQFVHGPEGLKQAEAATQVGHLLERESRLASHEREGKLACRGFRVSFSLKQEACIRNAVQAENRGQISLLQPSPL